MSPVHTTVPTYCALLTVAVTVTSASCVTVGAVQVDWNRPFESVNPETGFRDPLVVVSATVTSATAAPPAFETATWTVVVPPDVTDFVNAEIVADSAPSCGCFRLPKDQTLLIPPKPGIQPANEVRSYASRLS